MARGHMPVCNHRPGLGRSTCRQQPEVHSSFACNIAFTKVQRQVAAGRCQAVASASSAFVSMVHVHVTVPRCSFACVNRTIEQIAD